MADIMVYDASLAIDEFIPGSYCMFVRRTSPKTSHIIPESIEVKGLKKDFASYRKESKRFSLHEIRKIDESNFVAPGNCSLAKLAKTSGVDENTYIDMIKKKAQKEEIKFIFEYLENSLCKRPLTVGTTYKDEFFEYTVVEMKEEFATKYKIHLNKSDSKAISDSEAAKIELAIEGMWAYEPGLIIGTDAEKKNIYVQFEDSKDGECSIFRAGVELDSINEKIFERIQMYGD